MSQDVDGDVKMHAAGQQSVLAFVSMWWGKSEGEREGAVVVDGYAQDTLTHSLSQHPHIQQRRRQMCVQALWQNEGGNNVHIVGNADPRSDVSMGRDVNVII